MDEMEDEFCRNVVWDEGKLGEKPFMQNFDAVCWVNIDVHAGGVEFEWFGSVFIFPSLSKSNFTWSNLFVQVLGLRE